MPRNKGNFIRMELLSVEERRKECRRFQEHWYRLIAPWVVGQTVLDVGAGTGYGIDIMKDGGASSVCGIDPLPMRFDISGTALGDISSKSYDVVVACDVIEHVEEDVEFFNNLLRVARRHVFLATPNWNFSRCRNEYHVREYTPKEFKELLKDCEYKAFSSDCICQIHSISDLNCSFDNFGVWIDCKDERP